MRRICSFIPAAALNGVTPLRTSAREVDPLSEPRASAKPHLRSNRSAASHSASDELSTLQDRKGKP